MSDDVLERVRATWDAAASTYDEDPDHGLGDPRVRAAWHRRLRSWLPTAPADVLDLGCGTGSLSVLAAAQGHRVLALDLSPEMVALARAKAATLDVEFAVRHGDAGAPDLPKASVDAVLVRHVAWTLPDPRAALRRWVSLLRPGGRLVLVEGCWGVPAAGPPPRPDADGLPWGRGVRADDLVRAVRPLVDTLEVHDLAGDADLWGRAVDDESYVLVATRSAAA